MLNFTGAVIVLGTPGGGGGSGEARRTSASTSWSSSLCPDDRASCADSTRPSPSIAKLT